VRSDYRRSSETGSHQASTNSAIDAVKPCRKFLPPIGPISPRAVESRQREGPELLRTDRRVVIRAREQAGPPPIAGEQKRSGRRHSLPLEEAAQILIRGGRVPHVELDGLPDSILSPTATPRIRKSPRSSSVCSPCRLTEGGKDSLRAS